tara:strand:+ start:60 stop:671 length:612 start_codon:yes stop_codon:yes gene_type:complete
MYSEKFYNFKNFGVLEATIPKDFFKRLQAESVHSPGKNSIIKSGLSGNGIPKHFSLEENWSELEQFVLNLVPAYEGEFEHTNSKRGTLKSTMPFFKLGAAWFNHQKKHEFIPIHVHDGVYSFVVWLDIPYKIEDELSAGEYASCFQFVYTSTLGRPMTQTLPIGKEWVGKILLFPSKLQHLVYPFFTSNGTRVSLSGNIMVNE